MDKLSTLPLITPNEVVAQANQVKDFAKTVPNAIIGFISPYFTATDSNEMTEIQSREISATRPTETAYIDEDGDCFYDAEETMTETLAPRLEQPVATNTPYAMRFLQQPFIYNAITKVLQSLITTFSQMPTEQRVDNKLFTKVDELKQDFSHYMQAKAPVVMSRLIEATQGTVYAPIAASVQTRLSVLVAQSSNQWLDTVLSKSLTASTYWLQNNKEFVQEQARLLVEQQVGVQQIELLPPKESIQQSVSQLLSEQLTTLTETLLSGTQAQELKAQLLQAGIIKADENIETALQMARPLLIGAITQAQMDLIEHMQVWIKENQQDIAAACMPLVDHGLSHAVNEYNYSSGLIKGGLAAASYVAVKTPLLYGVQYGLKYGLSQATDYLANNSQDITKMVATTINDSVDGLEAGIKQAVTQHLAPKEEQTTAHKVLLEATKKTSTLDFGAMAKKLAVELSKQADINALSGGVIQVANNKDITQQITKLMTVLIPTMEQDNALLPHEVTLSGLTINGTTFNNIYLVVSKVENGLVHIDQLKFDLANAYGDNSTLHNDIRHLQANYTLPAESKLSKAAILADIAMSDRVITQDQLNHFLPDQISLSIGQLTGTLSGKIVSNKDNDQLAYHANGLKAQVAIHKHPQQVYMDISTRIPSVDIKFKAKETPISAAVSLQLDDNNNGSIEGQANIGISGLDWLLSSFKNIALSVFIPVKQGIATLDNPSIIKFKEPTNPIVKWVVSKLIQNTLTNKHNGVVKKADGSKVIHIKPKLFNDNTWRPSKWIGAKLANSIFNYFLPAGIEIPMVSAGFHLLPKGQKGLMNINVEQSLQELAPTSTVIESRRATILLQALENASKEQQPILVKQWMQLLLTDMNNQKMESAAQLIRMTDKRVIINLIKNVSKAQQNQLVQVLQAVTKAEPEKAMSVLEYFKTSEDVQIKQWLIQLVGQNPTLTELKQYWHNHQKNNGRIYLDGQMDKTQQQLQQARAEISKQLQQAGDQVLDALPKEVAMVLSPRYNLKDRLLGNR